MWKKLHVFAFTRSNHLHSVVYTFDCRSVEPSSLPWPHFGIIGFNLLGRKVSSIFPAKNLTEPRGKKILVLEKIPVGLRFFFLPTCRFTYMWNKTFVANTEIKSFLLQWSARRNKTLHLHHLITFLNTLLVTVTSRHFRVISPA